MDETTVDLAGILVFYGIKLPTFKKKKATGGSTGLIMLIFEVQECLAAHTERNKGRMWKGSRTKRTSRILDMVTMMEASLPKQAAKLVPGGLEMRALMLSRMSGKVPRRELTETQRFHEYIRREPVHKRNRGK